MELIIEVYRCTSGFPGHETYGLSGQMRRAAVSIPSNIAEGKGRYSQKELMHFLFRARGSLLELQTQTTIAQRLGYLDKARVQKVENYSDEVGRLLNGMISRFTEMQAGEIQRVR